MAALVWDTTGERFYETGVDHGVLYVMNTDGTYGEGVAWNGLVSVSESPSGAEANAVYADNIKYLNIISTEEFGATVEAYTYPDEFMLCDGSATLGTGVYIGQQARRNFGLVYRTRLGNDVVGDSLGYKIHIIYNATASPSEKAYQTVNDSPEAITFSWEITTTAINATGFRPTASLVIDSVKADATKLASIEAKLFGATSSDAELLLPDDIKAILAGS
ncbi:MAG: hypothetical protein LBD57_04250 [Endomicrobium sp.]|jgi:hypothetical protein|uniref:hypothetical protein n=1 Tax=Candidatus Endomicrobiellum cubanum TaxID=3242325 RepID=UPI00282034F8|nr:hypothetical protein [Endomicrobium sp.]